MKVCGVMQIISQPEVRLTENGREMCILRGVTWRPFKDDVYRDTIDVICFGNLIEVARRIPIGAIVDVDGTVRGVRRSIGGIEVRLIDIVADRITVLPIIAQRSSQPSQDANNDDFAAAIATQPKAPQRFKVSDEEAIFREDEELSV